MPSSIPELLPPPAPPAFSEGVFIVFILILPPLPPVVLPEAIIAPSPSPFEFIPPLYPFIVADLLLILALPIPPPPPAIIAILLVLLGINSPKDTNDAAPPPPL